MIDYTKQCSVLFFFANEKGKVDMMHYERPQYVDDYTLNEEAKENAKDMLKKKLNGANELVAIAIARSEMQHKDIMNQASQGFKQQFN